MKIKKIFATSLITILASPFAIYSVTLAADEGGSQGGDATICGYNLCNTYGATWRWYPTDSDIVNIAGTVNGLGVRSPAYAKDTVIRNCKKEGGYWRYAMVAEVTKEGAVRTDGTPVYKGEQVGTTSIGNATSLSLRSDKFTDGKMVYREERDHGKSWDDIKKIYLDAQKADPSTFWRGWNAASSLSWFCAPNPDLIYYAESNASTNGDYGGTGIVKEGEASVPTVKVKKGEKAKLAFSHNIYSSASVKNVDWQMQRTVQASITGGVNISLVGFQWSSYFAFNDSPKWGPWKSKADLTKEGSYGSANYTASVRDYTDGSRSYLTRDDLGEVTFKMPGTYTLCETMYIGATPIQHTKACLTVEVEDCNPTDPTCNTPGPTPPEELNLCKLWEPSEYGASYGNDSGLGEGWVRTRSGVRNPDVSPEWAVSNGIDNGKTEFEKNPVYARPGQEIEWNHCYYPGVQKLANKAKVTTKWNLCWASQTFKTVNNYITPWENKFSVKANYLQNNTTNANPLTTTMLKGRSDDGLGNFNTGDSEIKTWGIDTYTVETGNDSKAGKMLTETMTSGGPQYVIVSTESHSRGCCDHSCTCGEGENAHSCCCDGGDSITIHVEKNNNRPYSDTAMVKVPYNYENSISVNIDRSKNDGVAYSGEIIDIHKPIVQVSPKENNTTKGYYATKVDGGEVRILTYVTNIDQTDDSNSVPQDEYGTYGSNLCKAISNVHNNECAQVDEIPQTFNSRPENLGGSTDEVELTGGGTYNVFDDSAGRWYCVVAAVYPAHSGADTNMKGESGNAGSNSWRFSTPDCVKIAKKPSLQIWGNSLYTSGKIDTSTAGKRVIAGVYGFTPQSTDNQTVFGSWVEQSILHLDSIDGLASGASMGNYTSRPDIFKSRTPVKDLGGSKEPGKTSVCIRSPLTIPNSVIASTCNIKQETKDLGTKPNDKSALISHFTTPSTNYTRDNETSEINRDTVIPKNNTIVYNHGGGTFKINSNITYDNSNYQSPMDIPKVIIYANDIEIACGVKRVDAVLIAENKIDTCPAYQSNYDYNSAVNSNELKIFGSVITNSLEANRTHGAGPGIYSTVPAEIIDYDTSLYLWGLLRASGGTSGKLDITYQTEVAPRY